MRNTILKITCLGIGAFMLASCATMADNVAIVDKARIEENNKVVFTECKSSVQFSNKPRKAYLEEMEGMIQAMSDHHWQWEVEGFVYERNRLVEVAICLCSDNEIFDQYVDATRFSNLDGMKLLRTRKTEDAREIYEFDLLTIQFSDFDDLAQIIFPKEARNCFFAQVTVYPKSSASASPKFIASYQSDG